MLIVHDAALERAAEIVAFARLHANWYVPGHSAHPSTSPQYCHFFEPCFTVVFSWTYDVPNQKIYRQLAIRTNRPNKIPHGGCAFTMASWFGFTGHVLTGWEVTLPGKDWIQQPIKDHNTLILSQEIPYEEYSRFVA